MKGDLHPAAVRLSSALPCRTHERLIIMPKQGSKVTHKLEYDGRVFRTLSDAARECGMSRSSMRRKLADGEARYL